MSTVTTTNENVIDLHDDPEAARVAQIKREIQEGTYLTDEKLDCALSILLVREFLAPAFDDQMADEELVS
jgi:hypothetical protein